MDGRDLSHGHVMCALQLEQFDFCRPTMAAYVWLARNYTTLQKDLLPFVMFSLVMQPSSTPDGPLKARHVSLPPRSFVSRQLYMNRGQDVHNQIVGEGQ